MAEPKRTIKDSIFTFLFGEPEYTMELYQALHPEDTTVKDSDVKLVTLQNVLANGLYNDLGFQVRDKLILLVEAQSTFSENIPLRMLLYLAATYKDYVEEHKLSLYREKKVSIPRPELYVVYTGDKKHVPDELKLSSLFEGDGSVELSVKVLRDDGKGSILDTVEKRGVEKGENKLGLLMKKLFAAKRYADADEAATDKSKRNQLYREFGI